MIVHNKHLETIILTVSSVKMLNLVGENFIMKIGCFPTKYLLITKGRSVTSQSRSLVNIALIK